MEYYKLPSLEVVRSSATPLHMMSLPPQTMDLFAARMDAFLKAQVLSP